MRHNRMMGALYFETRICSESSSSELFLIAAMVTMEPSDDIVMSSLGEEVRDRRRHIGLFVDSRIHCTQ